MTDPISIPLTRNRYYIPDGPLAGSTIHPSPSKFRYATITSWYRNETGKHWQSNQLDASSSTMPIPTTPHAVTREIREMVARAFDRLEDGEGEEVVGIDTEKVGDVEGEEGEGEVGG
ncbi:hypothetical protein E2P81_ATG02515 [Venturia nashicola]|nr:hypothetical protein E2P81_ATG02515 [Venturia nashicola]